MSRNASLILVVFLLLLAMGCSNAPAPVATPPDTRAADVQAVKDVEAAWVKDAATKDANKWASYYTDDAAGLFPGSPTVTGKDGIKAVIAPMVADPNFALTFAATRTEASKGGDMVYSYGTYTMTMTNPKTKKPATDHGKYLTVYTKQADGSWKAVADTFNSDSIM
ncbi:MAG: SgcJ/EcaC family oxidoreductase [Terriglobales bacterium]